MLYDFFLPQHGTLPVKKECPFYHLLHVAVHWAINQMGLLTESLLCWNFYPTQQNTPVGTTLFQVHATDDDTGAAAIVTYAIDEVSFLCKT